jgi:hypothetical protein
MGTIIDQIELGADEVIQLFTIDNHITNDKEIIIYTNTTGK